MATAYPIPKNPKFQNLTGKKFNRLTVVSYAGKRGGQAIWNCACECGTESCVSSGALKSGRTKSCGCWKGEAGSKRRTSHGLSKQVPEYQVWGQMRQRCENVKHPAYKSYGARGIQICTRWLLFVNFYADMGSRPTKNHTIERIDNDKGYEPGNCRWATMREQGANTRKNRLISFDGKTMHMSEWARKLNIKPATLWGRLTHGWSVKEALTEPIQWDGKSVRETP